MKLKNPIATLIAMQELLKVHQNGHFLCMVGSSTATKTHVKTHNYTTRESHHGPFHGIQSAAEHLEVKFGEKNARMSD